jgi:nicotinamide mononucleotide transporter
MLATAFVLWGAAVTWLEIAAFALALGCVALSVLEVHWAWGLAIVSSLLYGWLFEASRLYGEAGLQLFFVAVAVWGWWQWLRGRRAAGGDAVRGHDGRTSGRNGDGRGGGDRDDLGRGGAGLAVAELDRAGRLRLIAAWALGWPLLALLLARVTDGDVPWLDAFPTVGSVIGQLLLGRKYLETWPVWIVVNLASVALFAWKALWLTALLYAVFAVLSVAGWRRWRQVMRSPAPTAAGERP